MTGRYPHNNGVRLQSDGPKFDNPTRWPATSQRGLLNLRRRQVPHHLAEDHVPPCFAHSTVMWGGYNNVEVRVDGVARTAPGYSTTYLGVRGREYITSALEPASPFLLYETPQAPHWVEVTNPDGTVVRRAVPEAKYADAPVGTVRRRRPRPTAATSPRTCAT